METALLAVILVLSVISVCVSAAAFVRSGKKEDNSALERSIEDRLSRTRSEINSATQSSLTGFSNSFIENQKQVSGSQDKRIEELTRSVNENITELRRSLEGRFATLREENNKSLAEIRSTVDEKLQTTLEKRITESFKTVSERLEEVYKGLGEMQSLAADVGGLKKVLANVKTRGILGEIQLGAILEEIMAPEQYEKDIATVRGSKNRVEFAVRMPGSEDGSTVYLPIDSKFPLDSYNLLSDAIDTGDTEAIKSAERELSAKIKSFAKDIHEKYISPPDTTDFGIMFLPTEGLYAEVLRLGLAEELQSKYKVNIAGPTTTAALLNSLRMGFRTLAIQKRSGEVWNILSAVRTEFETFEGVLKMTQNRLNQANDELDKLVGVRTRKILGKLKGVSSLPENEARELIGDDRDDAED